MTHLPKIRVNGPQKTVKIGATKPNMRVAVRSAAEPVKLPNMNACITEAFDAAFQANGGSFMVWFDFTFNRGGSEYQFSGLKQSDNTCAIKTTKSIVKRGTKEVVEQTTTLVKNVDGVWQLRN